MAPLARIKTNLLIAGLCLVAGCSKPNVPAGKLDPAQGPILASTWPLTTLARDLLGDDLPVDCLVEAGGDPLHWSPDPEALTSLAQARAVLLNGAGLESWLMEVNLAPTRVIDLSAGFADSWIEYSEELQHSHGSRGAHDHVGFDPHVWMDPLLALEQARALQKQTVSRGWITGQVAAERGARLEDRLRELDGLWAQVASALDGQSLLANHDAYSYPARRHQISIVVVDVDPEGAWDAALEKELRGAQSKHAPRLMLFEAAPNNALAAHLKDELHLTPFVLSPAETPSNLDFIESVGGDLKRLLKELGTPSAK